MVDSMFSGLDKAKVGQGGVYFLPGQYLVEVEAVKRVISRKDELYFIVECMIHESNNPERGPACRASYCCKKGNDSFLGNVKAFLAAANGTDPKDEAAVEKMFVDDKGNDIAVDVAEYAISDDNPLAGTMLNLVCVNKKTKAGKDFTLHAWSPVKKV